MLLKKNLFPCCSALLLSACVHYKAQPIQPVTTASQFSARSLDDPGLQNYFATHHTTLPTDTWDLQALTLAAFYFNPDLDVARAHWETVTAGRKTAGERPNPSLGFSPGYNSSTPSGGPSPWILGLNLDLPIETMGKRGLRLTQSSHLATSARFTLASVAWQVRTAVRRALIEYAAAQTEFQLRNNQAAAQTRNVAFLEKRFQAGESSAAEVSRERLALVATRMAATDAQQRTAASQSTLAVAIGVPVSVLKNVTLSANGLNPVSRELAADELRHQAMTNRADVLGALADYATTEAALQLEIAKQYPDIHLAPGYDYDQGDHKWSLGFSLELPIVNRNRGPIAEAVARRAEAAATFNAVQARALAEIERALAAYEAAQQTITLTDFLATTTTEQSQRLQATLAAGEVSAQEVAANQVELTTTQLTQLEALTRLQLTLSDLEAAVQSPLSLESTAWENPPRLSTTHP